MNNEKAIKEFVEYVWEFYKPGGIYGEYFKDSLVIEDVYYAAQFFAQRNEFVGDSIDRERVRDLMLFRKGLV